MCERESERERDYGHTVPGGVTATSAPTNAHKLRSSVIQNIHNSKQYNSCLSTF